MTYVNLEDAVKAVQDREAMHENAWYKAPNNEAKCNLDARKWEAHDIAQALRSLPTDDGVTDEMSLHAGNVFHDTLTAGKSAPEAMRAALEAALGPLPAPPTIEEKA